MIPGHLASTLVAKPYNPKMPWWMLIAAALFIDIVMFSLIALGMETMTPVPGHEGPTLAGAMIETTFSHDLLPQIFWTALVGGLVFLLTRKRRYALVAMALTFVHYLSDLVSGYGHFVFGPESHAMGTDWYRENLLAAVSFEALFSVTCVYLFVRNREFTLTRQALLYGLFGLIPFLFLFI